MPTFALLTKLSPEATRDAAAITEMSQAVTERIREQCPEVRWLASYFILGPYDYLDIYEAPSAEVASQVSSIMRTVGYATPETWTLIPFDRLKELLRKI